MRGRVIIVGASGRVLADSAGADAVGTSYAARPEIATALRGDVAQRRRTSLTLGEDILATAVPILSGAARPAGAVRVTQSVAAVNRTVLRTWLALGLIGLLVLALGLVAGVIIARRISQPDPAARRGRAARRGGRPERPGAGRGQHRAAGARARRSTT